MRTRQFFRPAAPVPPSVGGYSFEADAEIYHPQQSPHRPLIPHTDALAYDYEAEAVAAQEYASLAAVVSAIAGGQLVNGQFWKMTWTADAYHGTGRMTGRVVQGHPTWRGRIPTSKLGALPSVLSSAGTGALTYDGSGRPILTVGAVDGDFVEVLFGMKMAPALRVQMVTQYQSDAVTDNGSGIASLIIRRDGDPTKYIQLFNQYFSGNWYGGYYYQSSGGFGNDLLDTAPTDASKYTVAKEAAFTMSFASTGAQPVGTYRYESTGDGASQTSAATVAGEGDFTVATQLWQPYARLRSTGAAGSMLITGIEMATRT